MRDINRTVIAFLAGEKTMDFEEGQVTERSIGPICVEFGDGGYQVFSSLAKVVKHIEEMNRNGVSTRHLKLSPFCCKGKLRKGD